MRKNELDEMQLQKRNKFGNQAFMMLVYLLMTDVGLYGFGFRWLQYPTNVFVIMLACMLYYWIRLIWGNAYVGPKNKTKEVGKKSIYTIAISSFVAMIIFLFSQKTLLVNQTKEAGDNEALILFVTSTVALIIAALISVIKSKRDKNIDE